MNIQEDYSNVKKALDDALYEFCKSKFDAESYERILIAYPLKNKTLSCSSLSLLSISSHALFVFVSNSIAVIISSRKILDSQKRFKNTTQLLLIPSVVISFFNT
jgi:hypothetical protein